MAKVVTSISVDEKLLDIFRRETKSRDMKISAKIESLIREWLKLNNVNIDEGKKED